MGQFSFVWYIFVVLMQFTNFAYAAYLRLYCGNVENFTSTELDDPMTLLKSECFNASQETVIYAFGFSSSPEATSTVLIIESYLTLEKYNVFLIDWEKEASTPSGVLDPVTYAVSAVPNAKKVGATCGQSLYNMSEGTLNLTTTHVIGNSLGAQMVGYCGRELQHFNKNISRITGLDPAGPLFDGTISLDGLIPSSAEFVDVLHTNPGIFGTKEQIGQVDIWFNCNEKTQPNCVHERLFNKVLCGHGDAVKYYAQAVLNASAFLAEYSESCDSWQSLDISGDIIYVGETTNRQARGNFFLTTSPQYPFGQGVNGLQRT